MTNVNSASAIALFEVASRIKLRFSTGVGLISVEDLWDIPLTSKIGKANLDDIARNLNKSLKTADDDTVSFVNKSQKTGTSQVELDQLRFEIVKYVIGVRLEENEKRANAQANAEKRQRILQIMEERQENSLRNASDEELNKMLQEIAA